MERKTMGSLIAALRKANGMTQKELAERLHVSDKSVSRWERDEGVPDLALIPVIAEAFGITCDELLRGERRPPEPAPAPAAGPDPKAEKQRQRLLAVSMAQFRSRTLLAAAIAVVALLLAAGINFGFYKAVVALCVGAVCLLCAALVEANAVNKAVLAVTGAEEAPETVGPFRWRVAQWSERTFLAIFALLAFLLPLALAGGYGLTMGSWLLWGLPAVLIALVIGVTVCGFVDGRRLEDPDLALPEPQAAALRRNARLARRTGLGLAAAWVVTLLLHALLTHGWSEWALRPATTFPDWGSFAAFMEREEEAIFYGPAAPAPDMLSDEAAAPPEDTETPELEPETITAEDGSVVCTFYWRNRQVTGWSYSTTVDGRPVLPVRVYTQRDGEIGRERLRQYNLVFGCLYVAETLAAALALALCRKAVPRR